VRHLAELDEDIERRAASAVGTVLDRKWRLDRLLGCGGMGAVYAATHRNGTRAAVKVLLPEAALSPILRRRFLREGYVANKVEHPGAVSIVDDDIDETGNAYLVMELLHGETLETRIARAGRLDERKTIQIACGVLDCLEAAHARGIVHRDIKPGNLFLTTDGTVKILDFGIARLTERRGKQGDTTGVQALGTPDFMPPEQARGHWDRVDARSDVFAVGAVMLFALTGKKLRNAPTTNEQLLAAMVEPAPRLATLLPEAPELVANLVDRALAFDKDDRWPDAASFRQAARAAYGSVAEQPIELAPKLSVRPVPNGPMSLIPEGNEEEYETGDAIGSAPATSLSARSLSPTRLVVTRRGWPFLRVAVVVCTVAGALFAMTFRDSVKARPPEVKAAKASLAAPSPTSPGPANGAPPALGPAPDGVVKSTPPMEEPSAEQDTPKVAAMDSASRSGARTTKKARSGSPVAAADPVEAPNVSPQAAPAPGGEGTNEGKHVVDLFSRRR
jgi:serine/threonine-protein kinase